MLHRLALVGTDVSEESITSIIKGTRIGELGTTLALTSNLSLLSSAIFLTHFLSHPSYKPVKLCP
jgi:hypothetical protein